MWLSTACPNPTLTCFVRRYLDSEGGWVLTESNPQGCVRSSGTVENGTARSRTMSVSYSQLAFVTDFILGGSNVVLDWGA